MAFLRHDLSQLAAYQSPHPVAGSQATGGSQASLDEPLPLRVDALDTNESPIDLPETVKAELAEYYREAIAANRYPDGTQLALKQAVTSYVIESAVGLVVESADKSTAEPAIDASIKVNGALGSHLKAKQVAISPANITLGNGSDELIRSVIMATCLGNHGSILVAAPTFSMYAILANTLGVTVHTVGRSDTFEVDLVAADAAIQSAALNGLPIRCVFMVHPNSPTGNALTPRELTWLRQLPEDILIVVDEAYFEFSGRTTVTDALSRPNWLVTRTFSKALRLAAHRVGYGIAHSTIIAALEKLRLPYNLPSFSQVAAHTALTHRVQILSQIPDILAERNRLYQALSDHPYLQVWPSDSNFLYVRLQANALSVLEARSQAEGLIKLLGQLKEKGTLVRQTGGGIADQYRYAIRKSTDASQYTASAR